MQWLLVLRRELMHVHLGSSLSIWTTQPTLTPQDVLHKMVSL